MQSMTTIDLPTHDPPTGRYRKHAHHVAYVISVPNAAVQIAADEPEQIATWFEYLAAEVRSRAFEQTLTEAALSGVQGDHATAGGES